MESALTVSRAIDAFLWVMAKMGAWCALLLVLVVTYDVTTRYLGVPKVFGLTSTMLQESEYWLHSFLIVLVVGYAYTKQSHVRIDLIREKSVGPYQVHDRSGGHPACIDPLFLSGGLVVLALCRSVFHVG